MKRGSLSTSITLLLLITSLILLGGGALLMDNRIDSKLEERYRETLLAQARSAATVIELENEIPEAHGLLRPLGELFGGHGDIYYELQCAGQETVRSEPGPPVLPAGWPRHASTDPHFDELTYDGRPLGSVMLVFAGAIGEHPPGFVPLAAQDCRLLFQQDRRQFDHLLLDIDWILAIGPVLAVLIAFIAVPLVVRRGLRPVNQLVDDVDSLGPQAPGQRLNPTGLAELDPLVQRFNQTLERMDEGLARERQFASGLAHETRTRLAELRALTEVELRYPTGRSITQLLGEIAIIGAELEGTVTALLLLTRLQAGLDQPQPQPLHLTEWLERLLHRHQAQTSSRLVETHIELGPSDELHTDPALLELVVGNLISNALAYAPEGDTIQVRADASGFHIDNATLNLQWNDMPNLGQRFWRKQPQHTGHAGLGLALAIAAAQALAMPLEFTLAADQRLHADLTWQRRSEA